MKYPTLHKVMLATMALVASLALSAQAGPLSTAKQQQGKRNGPPGHFPFSAQTAGGGNHSPLQFIYQLDDGTAEDAIGLTAGGDTICLNEFAVVPGSETIESIEIAWGTPAFFDPSLDGLPYTVAVWSDPNGDGNPNDAALLTTAGGVVSNQGTDTFISTDITDTAITTSNFFVGFVITQFAGQFPAAFDQSNPLFNRSYIAGDSQPGGGNIMNLNDNELPVAPIESFGLIGNWLIRATAGGSPTPTPTATPPPAGALWYNGEFNGVDGLTNEQDTFATGYSRIYDDFNVPDAEGWDVNSVFSENLASTNITSATFEIRQGVSAGNPGTLIASGTTVTPEVTPTGRSGFGFTEFKVQVNDLNIHLDPGDYFLNVTPVDNLDGGRSFDSTTSGFNCIGTPCGDNDNAFLDSTLFGAFFAPVADFGSQFSDFSMGVNGEVSGGGGDLTLVSAASVKGPFAIDLPLTGPSGVEDRSGGPNKKLTIKMTFNNNIVSVDGAGVSCSGALQSLVIDGNTVTTNWVNVAHACNGMNNDVTLSDIRDDQGNLLGLATVSVGMLLGDVNADRVVNRSDVNAAQMDKGQKTDQDNFRSDVNASGHINRSDIELIRQQKGTSLP